MKLSNYKININRLVNTDEIEFFMSCISKNDFKTLIGDFTINDIDKFYVFSYRGCMLGLFNPQIKEITGLKISSPIIYMVKRFSKLTGWCLLNMIYLLFNDFKIAKLQIIVYGNNIGMNKMMYNYDIKCEGLFKNSIQINGEIIDLHYYSILEEEFDNLYKKWVN